MVSSSVLYVQEVTQILSGMAMNTCVGFKSSVALPRLFANFFEIPVFIVLLDFIYSYDDYESA